MGFIVIYSGSNLTLWKDPAGCSPQWQISSWGGRSQSWQHPLRPGCEPSHRSRWDPLAPMKHLCSRVKKCRLSERCLPVTNEGPCIYLFAMFPILYRIGCTCSCGGLYTFTIPLQDVHQQPTKMKVVQVYDCVIICSCLNYVLRMN